MLIEKGKNIKKVRKISSGGPYIEIVMTVCHFGLVEN